MGTKKCQERRKDEMRGRLLKRREKYFLKTLRYTPLRFAILKLRVEKNEKFRERDEERRGRGCRAFCFGRESADWGWGPCSCSAVRDGKIPTSPKSGDVGHPANRFIGHDVESEIQGRGRVLSFQFPNEVRGRNDRFEKRILRCAQDAKLAAASLDSRK